VLAQVPLGVPELPLMSCVTGTPMSDEQATQPDYWSRSVVEPVRFAQAAAALLASHGDAVFIECGPGRALGSLLRAQGNGTAPLVLPALAAAGDVDADRRGMLSMVGRAWAAGVSVDWQAFWQHRPARRTRLPGYAFQRKRFWVDAPPEAAASAARPATAPAGALAPSAEHTFVRAWAPSPAASVAPTADAGARADFVVLTADPGFGMGLAQRLQHSGSRVVAVHAAPLSGAIAGVGAGVRSIDISDTDLRDADAAEALARRLVIGLRPDVPLHLVNALPLGLPPGVPSVDRAERGAWLAFHAPLRLLRALRSVQRHVAVMDTITMQLFPLLPGERPEPAAAPAMGLARVLPQEVQGLRARIIDIAQPRGGNDAPRVLDQLAAELLRLGAETVLAYRGEQRLVEGFAPVPLPRALRVRPGGCFLLTGGFGAIGSVLAKALAQASPGARIVLVGRRGLGDADGQAGQSARELVAALHRQGAEVLPVAADMSEPDAVRAVIGQVHARFGRIDGVVHCAGVAGGRMLLAPPDAVPGQVMVPKVRGTVALLEALSASAPDFVVLCSSFATISGGLGQGEYCAANAFLDAMAWSARAMGLRVTSIVWPAWRDAGMAVAMTLPPELEHLRRASLDTGISSAEGAELFLRVLAADLPQVVIAPLPSRPALEPAVVPAAAARRAEAHVEHVGVEATAPESCEPAVGATPFPDSGSDEDPEVRRMLVERIGAIWSAVLGVTAPTAEDNFFELGGQSLMALQIVARCGEQFGISIGLPDVFDQPSLGGFAALVQRRMVQRVMAMPDEEVRQRLAGASP
jgi:acyl transferase domain-containing protein/acyl carrier protein